VKPGREDFENVFVSLAVPAAGNVCVGKFVHDHDSWPAGQNCIRVHFFEHGAFVIDLAAGNCFELCGQIGDAFTPMRFDDADRHVFAAAMPAKRLAQHAVRLADSGRVAEKQFQNAFGFFAGLRIFHTLFGSFRHGSFFYFPPALKSTVEWRGACDFFY
jgi:hypothetical protein